MASRQVPCIASLVVAPGGRLQLQFLDASSGAQVFLNGGSIAAPLVQFDTAAMLGGSGAVTGGEVVMRGDSVLLSGPSSAVDPQCWPGYVSVDLGDLRIDTLRVGPAVIQGGENGDTAPWGVSVQRLVVDAGTTTTLDFLGAGVFVAFQTIDVSRTNNILGSLV